MDDRPHHSRPLHQHVGRTLAVDRRQGGSMILARFKIRCRPDRTEEVATAIAAAEAPSRELPGVVHFDVARSLADPNAFVVEVFEDLRRWNARTRKAKSPKC
jgi:quinol monooxygenase YgiN